jgi:hypothetical protein
VPPATGAASTSRIVSPWRKPSRRSALPLRRQPSSARHGDAGSGALAAARRAAFGVALDLGERGDEPGVVGRRRFGREEPVVLALDQRGVEIGVGERRRRDEAAEELDVVGDADDAVARERVAHPRERGGAVGAVDDQLGDHRVVERRDRVAFFDAGVDAHACALGRRRQMHESSRRRQEAAVGILGVDARLDRVARDRKLLLRLRQRLAGGNAQLPLDEVDAGDHLGDRMLDLQPRVHLHEVEAAVGMGDELDRAGADVADRARRIDRGATHRRAPLGGHARRRRFLEHLLVATLHRAVALEEKTQPPRVSAKTWISMCRGLSTYCSTRTWSSPNALFASRLHDASAAAKSSPRSTRRMPLPPPPALALISTGKPIFAASRASSASSCASPW